jgi:hypothetical protein
MIPCHGWRLRCLRRTNRNTYAACAPSQSVGGLSLRPQGKTTQVPQPVPTTVPPLRSRQAGDLVASASAWPRTPGWKSCVAPSSSVQLSMLEFSQIRRSSECKYFSVPKRLGAPGRRDKTQATVLTGQDSESGQWQGICRSPSRRPGIGHSDFLCRSVLQLAAREQRKLQRPDEPVHSQKASHENRDQRGADYDREQIESPTPKEPQIQDTPRAVTRLIKPCCASFLTPIS